MTTTIGVLVVFATFTALGLVIGYAVGRNVTENRILGALHRQAAVIKAEADECAAATRYETEAGLRRKVTALVEFAVRLRNGEITNV